MHRGSSKGAWERRVPETLPLSAPPAGPIEVVVEVVRGQRSTVHTQQVSVGTSLRVLLRTIGEAPEGSAVLLDGRSLPLDHRLDAPVRLTVVPTFSGG